MPVGMWALSPLDRKRNAGFASGTVPLTARPTTGGIKVIICGTREEAEEFRELEGEQPLCVYRHKGWWHVGTEDDMQSLITETICDMDLGVIWTHNARRIEL